MLLEYDNARYYNSSNGRFISPDPSGMADGSNLYVYGNDDPINRSDYTGKDSILDDGGGSVLGGGGGSVLGDGGGAGDGLPTSYDGGSGDGIDTGIGSTDFDDGSSDTVSQPVASLPDTSSSDFYDDDASTAGAVDLGTPDQFSSLFDGYSSTDISLDDAPTPSDAELDDLDLSGLGEDDFDAAMSTAFSDQDVSDPFAASAGSLSSDLNNFDSDFAIGGSLGLAGTLGTDGLYDQSWSSAFWSAALGDDDDLGISNVTQPGWIDDTATASRDVGIGALTLATGGLAGGAVEALGIGGGLGSILTGAASGAASSFTLSTLAQATETGGFNLSLVDPGETAYDTALGLGAGGLLGGALYGANVFGSDAANWLSSFGDNSSGLALAGGGVDAASSDLAGIGESVSPGWIGGVGGDLTTLFSEQMPGWKQYEVANGSTQTPMSTTFHGEDVDVVLDQPPGENGIIDYKDYDWSNPAYERPFIQQKVIQNFQEQILKYQTINPTVEFQFSQEPPTWVTDAIQQTGGKYSVKP